MNPPLHTILGATGATGQAILHELQARNLRYRLTSRTARPEQEEYVQVDLLDAASTQKAIAGSTYVYLCVGLPYKTEIWEAQWEVIMQNVTVACAQHGAKLIFLDNVYLYTAPLPQPFDENTPQQPVSKKGKVRKRTADLLMQAMKNGKVQGVIGRSADFFGPGAVHSPFYISFLERMMEGKNPQTLAPGNVKHTYANVQDNGRALVELALCEECYGQAWHLPVGEPITANEMLAIFNRLLDTDFKLSVMPRFLRSLLSVFVPVLREVGEMQYQFEAPYVMSFDKFKNQFPDFVVTTNEEGAKRMIQWLERVDGSELKLNV